MGLTREFKPAAMRGPYQERVTLHPVACRRFLARLLTTCLAATLLAACGSDAPDKVVTVAVSFGNPVVPGELVLPGRSGNPPVVVMLAGAGPNDMDETTGAVTPLRDLAYGLAAKGVASLRFDKPTLTGAPHNAFTPTDEYVDYAVNAFALLEKSGLVDPARIYLLGHSFGGTMAPRAVATQPRYAGVILMAALAGTLPDVLLRHFTYMAGLGGELGRDAAGQVPVAQGLVTEVASSLAPRVRMASPLAHEAIAKNLTGSYFLDLRGYDAVAAAARLPHRMLVLQGDRDYLVTVENDLARWTRALGARTDVAVRRYPNANHTMVDGTGIPTPEEYARPGRVNAQVISDIAGWVKAV